MKAVAKISASMHTTLQKNVSSRLAFMLAAILLQAAPAVAQSYTLSPSPFLTVFNDSGLFVPGGCIWTYAAGTLSPITTYSNTAGAQNSQPIVADAAARFTAYLIAGTNYKFVYENTPCSSLSHGAVLKTADNILGTPVSAATVDVTGTAGETLNAGQCAYLSDGSGSLNAGQWYKCDADFTYASITPTIGVATGAITAATTGSIRIQGAVTGLSSLSVGAEYFVSTTAGALTNAPGLSNRRHLGHADSSTTLILTANPQTPVLVVPNNTQDFRLSLTSGSCVTTADVTAATTLYFTPCTGNRIALTDSTGLITTYSSAELSIAVPATTSQMYDVWVVLSSGAPSLELLTWTNDTTRATAIARTTTGFYTKTGDLTRRYVGSFRTTAVSGQTEDSVTNRFVWNYYNRADRPLQRFESTASWTYSTNTIRQANGAAANQVNFVIGVAEEPVEMDLHVSVQQATATANIIACFGLDSTSTCASNQGVAILQLAGSTLGWLHAHYKGQPAIGRHFLSWNEDTSGTGTTTWYGTTATYNATTTAASVVGGILGGYKG